MVYGFVTLDGGCSLVFVRNSLRFVAKRFSSVRHYCLCIVVGFVVIWKLEKFESCCFPLGCSVVLGSLFSIM